MLIHIQSAVFRIPLTCSCKNRVLWLYVGLWHCCMFIIVLIWIPAALFCCVVHVCVSVFIFAERPTDAVHSLCSSTVGRDPFIFNIFLSIIHSPNLSASLCKGPLIGWDISPFSPFILSLTFTFFFLFTSHVSCFPHCPVSSTRPAPSTIPVFIRGNYGTRKLYGLFAIHISWLRGNFQNLVSSYSAVL